MFEHRSLDGLATSSSSLDSGPASDVLNPLQGHFPSQDPAASETLAPNQDPLAESTMEKGASVEDEDVENEDLPPPQTPPTGPETPANDSAPACRICLADDELTNLIRPCRCDGSSRWVHRSCLDTWRAANPKAFYRCDVCQMRFKLAPGKTLSERRWGCLGAKAMTVLDIAVYLMGLLLLWLTCVWYINDTSRWVNFPLREHLTFAYEYPLISREEIIAADTRERTRNARIRARMRDMPVDMVDVSSRRRGGRRSRYGFSRGFMGADGFGIGNWNLNFFPGGMILPGGGAFFGFGGGPIGMGLGALGLLSPLFGMLTPGMGPSLSFGTGMHMGGVADAPIEVPPRLRRDGWNTDAYVKKRNKKKPSRGQSDRNRVSQNPDLTNQGADNLASAGNTQDTSPVPSATEASSGWMLGNIKSLKEKKKNSHPQSRWSERRKDTVTTVNHGAANTHSGWEPLENALQAKRDKSRMRAAARRNAENMAKDQERGEKTAVLEPAIVADEVKTLSPAMKKPIVTVENEIPDNPGKIVADVEAPVNGQMDATPTATLSTQPVQLSSSLICPITNLPVRIYWVATQLMFFLIGCLYLCIHLLRKLINYCLPSHLPWISRLRSLLPTTRVSLFIIPFGLVSSFVLFCCFNGVLATVGALTGAMRRRYRERTRELTGEGDVEVHVVCDLRDEVFT